MKFVRLANNNPNEHEANSAARRVCKIIAEANFNFTPDKPEIPEPSRRNSTPPPTPKQNPYKPEYSYYSQPDYYSWVKDFYTNPRTGRKSPFAEGSWSIPKQDEPKKKQESRKRKCVKCGVENETVNINNVYTCGPCQWREWTEKQAHDF